MTLSTKLHQRYYSENGDYLPGASTIAGLWPDGNYLIMGAAVKLTKEGKDHKLVWDQLAKEGTCAHYLAQCSIMSQTPELGSYPPDIVKVAKPCHKQFLKWLRTNDVIALASEVWGVSEEHRFGGCVDLLAMLNGNLTVIDIKRTKSIYAGHRMQLAAYTRLVAEVLDVPIPDGCIVRLNPSGTGYEVRYYDNLDMEWQCFLWCRSAYDLIRQLNARG